MSSIYPESVRRLMARCTIDYKTGCWLWNGGCTRDGYAAVWNGTTMSLGHKFTFEETYKRKVPPHLILRHKCNTERCINPMHVIEGTDKENSADAKAHNGKFSMAKLTEDQVREIRRLWDVGKLNQMALGVMFNVHGSTIGQIVNRKTWQDLV